MRYYFNILLASGGDMFQVNKNGISIRSRVTVFATIIAIAILAVAFVITFKLFSAQFKQSIAADQFKYLSFTALQLDARLLLAQQQLELLAKEINPNFVNSPEKLQKFLDREKGARSTFDAGFVIISDGGRMLAASPLSLAARGKDYLFRDYVMHTLTFGTPYISSPFKTLTPPYDPLIAFSVPIKNKAGQTVALLAGLHNLLHDSFLRPLAKQSDKNYGYTYIFTFNRVMVVHPDKTRIMEQIKLNANRGIDRAIGEGFEGSLENANASEVAAITSFKRLKHAEWYLASHVPIDGLYQHLFIAGYELIAVFVLLGMVAGLVMWLVMGRMMSPLQMVIDQIGTVHIKTGGDRYLPDIFDGDLRLLSCAFNKMVTEFDLQHNKLILMQSELGQQKAFAEGILNKAAVPIFVLDINHRIIVWNKAMESLTGLQAEEMLGTNRQWLPFYENERPVLAELILSVDELHLHEWYDTYRMSQHVLGGYQAEGWLEHVGGLRRYLLFDAAPVFDTNDVRLGAIETVFDITDRKQAEEEQRKLSRAVSENPCSIIITAFDGSIEYVNQKFCEVTGYTVQEVVGQNPRLLKSNEMLPENYAKLWNDISHGRTWHGEFHNKKKSGELYWEIASISPVMDEEGKITHYLAVKEDITQRKLFEAELAKSRDELQRKHSELGELFAQVEIGKQEWEDTVDSLPEMVLMCDQHGVVKRCNRAVTAFTGLSYNEVIDTDFIDLFSEAGLEIDSFDGTSGKLLFGGGLRHFEMLSNELRQVGTYKIRGVVITIHETTELFHINEKLQKAYTELQQTQTQIFHHEKMASIGQLAAGVAHEINNPMGFISSNLSTMGKYMEKITAFEVALIETVRERGDSETDDVLHELRSKMKVDFILDDIRSLLAESRDGAERVRRIVQDLKSFSRVDEAEYKSVSINESLDTTLNILRNEIKYIADVEQEYDPDLPFLSCYPQRLNQVFMNILVNAAHAIKVHGVIKVSTKHEFDDVVVRISDSGNGIAPENLSRIFEPFFTTKEVGKGTGLGLSISYDIIKKHGGDINVESEVGVGTTFVIRLPLHYQHGGFEDNSIAGNEIAGDKMT